MKKTLFLGLIAGWLGLSSFSPDYVPKADEVTRFYTTKTMVVLDPNPLSDFNLAIKGFMDKEWTLTPFELISYSKFEELRLDPQYSFIMMSKVRFESDKTGTSYKFLSVLLGGDEKVISNMPDLCPVPLGYAEVEEDHYLYKMPVILRFMQSHIERIHKDPSIIATNVFKYYNRNMSSIKNKTLYLVDEELAPDCNTDAKIKKVYPNKFKIVSREDVEKAIEDRDTTISFIHKVGPEGTKLKARCYKIIMGAGDNNFYYFDWHNIDDDEPDGFLVKDLKKLGKK
jgi:hypothetical protein